MKDPLFRAFLDGYVTAMLWANTHGYIHSPLLGPELVPVQAEGMRDDLTWSAVRELYTDARAFYDDQQADLTLAAAQRSWEDCGHDYALTRNGHGTGFWDRGLGELGDRLTAACRPWGDAGLVWDGGKIYPE